MSDHTTAVTGTRAHPLAHALAATSLPHCNPDAHHCAAVYQATHLLRALLPALLRSQRQLALTCPLGTSRASAQRVTTQRVVTQRVVSIEWAQRQAVLRKFDAAATAKARLELQRSKLHAAVKFNGAPTREDLTALELSSASKKAIAVSLAKEVSRG